MKPFVHTLSRPLLGAAAGLAVGLSALAPAVASADSAVQTTPATAVTDTTATLNGVVGQQQRFRVYTFQYGIDRYDHQTPITALPPSGNGPRSVSAAVSGLTAATQYHFRLVAGDGGLFGWESGGDQTFTTAPPPAPLPAAVAPPAVAPPPPPAAAAPVPPAPAPAAPPAAAQPAAAPALGQTVGVAPVSGTIKVRAPGASG